MQPELTQNELLPVAESVFVVEVFGKWEHTEVVGIFTDLDTARSCLIDNLPHYYSGYVTQWELGPKQRRRIVINHHPPED